MASIKRGHTLKQISDMTGIKYSTLSERVRINDVRPIYVICENRGPGTNRGNLYDIEKVLSLFQPKERGRPRTLKV
jgi:hypothetical protein